MVDPRAEGENVWVFMQKVEIFVVETPEIGWQSSKYNNIRVRRLWELFYAAKQQFSKGSSCKMRASTKCSVKILENLANYELVRV